MSDDALRWYQQEIRNRAADLRAVAAEMNIGVGRVVERSRERERLRREPDASRSAEREGEFNDGR